MIALGAKVTPQQANRMGAALARVGELREREARCWDELAAIASQAVGDQAATDEALAFATTALRFGAEVRDSIPALRDALGELAR